MLAEEQLDLAVESAQLGPGEPVVIVTKCGDEVSRGTVREVFLDGSVWVESKDGDRGPQISRVYTPELYSFISLEPPVEDHGDPSDGPEVEPDDDGAPSLTELASDRRARLKLESLGINLEAIEDEPVDDDEADGGSPGKKKGKKSGKKRTKADSVDGEDKENGKGGTRFVQPKSSEVDIANLPDAVQAKIKGMGDLDSDSLDHVLSSVSTATVRGLRDVGVKDQEVYTLVVQAQDGIRKAWGVDQDKKNRNDLAQREA